MSLSADERSACRKANSIQTKNYSLARKEADTFNANRKASCTSCKNSAEYWWPRPVKASATVSCGTMKDDSIGVWEYKANQAEATKASLLLEEAELVNAIADNKLIIELPDLGAALKLKYFNQSSRFAVKLTKLRLAQAVADKRVRDLTAAATLQRTQWDACLASDVAANVIYQKELSKFTFERDENVRKCALCSGSQRIVAKPRLNRCSLTGVGEALIDEAVENETRAKTMMTKYKSMMGFDTSIAGSSSVVTVDPRIVNRWIKVTDETGEVAEEDHQAWHQTYAGTASDQSAHEDMHTA